MTIRSLPKHAISTPARFSQLSPLRRPAQPRARDQPSHCRETEALGVDGPQSVGFPAFSQGWVMGEGKVCLPLPLLCHVNRPQSPEAKPFTPQPPAWSPGDQPPAFAQGRPPLPPRPGLGCHHPLREEAHSFGCLPTAHSLPGLPKCSPRATQVAPSCADSGGKGAAHTGSFLGVAQGR